MGVGELSQYGSEPRIGLSFPIPEASYVPLNGLYGYLTIARGRAGIVVIKQSNHRRLA